MRREHRQEPQHPVSDLHSWGKVAPPLPAPGHVEINVSDVAPQYQKVADAGVIGFPAVSWVERSKEKAGIIWVL